MSERIKTNSDARQSIEPKAGTEQIKKMPKRKQEPTEFHEDRERWQFSKKLTFFFMVVFGLHLVILLISALFEMGDYRMIRDSFVSSLPFYGVIFTGYTAKAAFENYDKFTKQYKVTMKQMEYSE